jgi:hypothetical protein
MSNNTKIFSEAIAEAKAIRETAMVNAKLALEEAFTPRIQEMMSDKLSALAEEDEMEEGYSQEEMNNEEISLEELLAELDGLEESADEEKMEEGKEEMDENLNEAEAEDEVGEITVDELKDIIRDVLADVMGSGEEEMEDAGEMEAEEEMEDEEISLDEILAEIASLDEENLDEMSGTSMREPSSSAAAGADQIVNMVKSAIKSSPAMASKIMKALQDAGEASGAAMRAEADNSELEEAMNAIATLRSELNEVNLLNAKLLYVNKLFKAKNLNESQKVKVINAFDRAETVREAKNVYDTLSESLSTEKAKSQIKESLSFASKAAGVSDRKPIMENIDSTTARWQKLAGIIK